MPTRLNAGPMRIRILLPNEELPRWVGEVLLALDRLQGVTLQLQYFETFPPPPFLSAVSRGWRARIPALVKWSPDHVPKMLAVRVCRASGWWDKFWGAARPRATG